MAPAPNPGRGVNRLHGVTASVARSPGARPHEHAPGTNGSSHDAFGIPLCRCPLLAPAAVEHPIADPVRRIGSTDAVQSGPWPIGAGPARPAASNHSDTWIEQASRTLETGLGLPANVRVLVNRAGVLPQVRGNLGPLTVAIQTDPVEFRGTAGLLRDIMGHYGEQDYIIVGNGSAVLLQPLPAIVQELRETAGDVALLAYEDGSPLDVMVVRCGCLQVIPAIGFCDLKEQGLLLMSRKYKVRVVPRRDPASLSVRTLRGYICALRRYHRVSTGSEAANPFEEDWKPLFSVREEGAEVHPSARLHDAVVLAGGRVERGAVVIRSVVCPGGVVPTGARWSTRSLSPAKDNVTKGGSP